MQNHVKLAEGRMTPYVRTTCLTLLVTRLPTKLKPLLPDTDRVIFLVILLPHVDSVVWPVALLTEVDGCLSHPPFT